MTRPESPAAMNRRTLLATVAAALLPRATAAEDLSVIRDDAGHEMPYAEKGPTP